MTGTRLRALGWIAALTVVAVIAPAPARADPSLSDVLGALGVDRVPADYVVMVDVSASMQQSGRYAAVKESLRSFFSALAPDDQVALGTFGDRATIVRQGPAERAPDALVAALPTTATGGSTDIGAALEAAVTVLQRPGAPAVATVVLLTDGLHEPPPGSAFPYAEGYAWNRLAESVRAMHKSSLTAFAVPLGGATGAGLLGKVFPGARVVDPTSIDRLTTELDKPKAAARSAKARSVLSDDLTRGVTVEWPSTVRDLGAGPTTVAVRLTARTTYIPLTVSDFAVRADDPSVRASVRGGPITLTPGGSATVEVTVDWDAGPRRVAPWSTASGRTGLELAGTVGSPWKPVLTTDLGLTFGPRLDGGGTDAALSAQRGSLPVWIACAVVLGALLLLLRRMRGRRLQPALSGVLHARTRDGDEHQLALSGRSATISAATIGLPGYGEAHPVRASVTALEVVLRITYTPDGTEDARETGSCGPGEEATVGGVRFSWRGVVPPARRGEPTAAVKAVTREAR